MHTTPSPSWIITALLLSPIAAVASPPSQPRTGTDPNVEEPRGAGIFLHIVPADTFDGRQRLVFAKALRDELSKLRDARVSTEAPVTASNAENSCPEQETSCLARLAEGLGAEEIVIARAADLDSSKVLTLKRVRIRDGAIMGAVTRQMSGGHGEEFLLMLGDGVAELFAEVPLGAEEIRGADPALVDRFNPPPLSPWQFYSLAGGTLIAAGAAVGLTLATRSAENDYNEFAEQGLTAPIDGRTLTEKGDRVGRHGRYADVAWITTGLFGIGTAIAFFFTDWTGDGALSATLVQTGGGAGLVLGGYY